MDKINNYLTKGVYDPRKSELRKKELKLGIWQNSTNFDKRKREKERLVERGINRFFNQILNK